MNNRDYTLIIDRSGSMSKADQDGGLTRWQAVQESVLALARKCEKFDPDGLTVYVFSSRFQRYDHVTSDKVEDIFLENEPMGRTNLAIALQDALNNFLNHKKSGQMTKEGETIFIIMDGEPDDKRAVIEMIINTSKSLDRDEELALCFIQVGDDAAARQFFKALDDQLMDIGAKFDICDTISMDEMLDLSLTEILMKAIED
jgi:uncharacterized protein YegL